MTQIPEKQLLEWKKGLDQEIEEIRLKIKPLTDKLAGLQEKQRAIEKLIGIEATESKGISQPKRPHSNGSFAPTHAYWVPILESLVERGGIAEAESVLDLVQKKMSGILTPEDFELLPSGISVRWRNRAQWQRKNMVDQGLLSSQSPRGKWQITVEGRKWLEKNKGKV
jgi:Mrr N-terminal domain